MNSRVYFPFSDTSTLQPLLLFVPFQEKVDLMTLTDWLIKCNLCSNRRTRKHRFLCGWKRLDSEEHSLFHFSLHPSADVRPAAWATPPTTHPDKRTAEQTPTHTSLMHSAPPNTHSLLSFITDDNWMLLMLHFPESYLVYSFLQSHTQAISSEL